MGVFVFTFITFSASSLSQSVVLTPVFDEIEEDDENVTFSLLGPQLAGHDYTVGEPSLAEIIILDFVDIIFRDGFEQD